MIPVQMYEPVVQLVRERLRDKAVQVRKNAVHLLTALMQYNPFAPSLRIAAFLMKLPHDKKKQILKEQVLHTQCISNVIVS